GFCSCRRMVTCAVWPAITVALVVPWYSTIPVALGPLNAWALKMRIEPPGAGAAGMLLTLPVQTFPAGALVSSVTMGKPGPGVAASEIVSWMLLMSDWIAWVDTATLALANFASSFLAQPMPIATATTAAVSTSPFLVKNILSSPIRSKELR